MTKGELLASLGDLRVQYADSRVSDEPIEGVPSRRDVRSAVVGYAVLLLFVAGSLGYLEKTSSPDPPTEAQQEAHNAERVYLLRDRLLRQQREYYQLIDRALDIQQQQRR
jgi:hypothetical protein